LGEEFWGRLDRGQLVFIVGEFADEFEDCGDVCEVDLGISWVVAGAGERLIERMIGRGQTFFGRLADYYAVWGSHWSEWEVTMAG
jgi:hypothetical protein